MTRVLAWLRKPLLGVARWRWLACLVLATVCACLARSALAAAWGLLTLVPLRAPAREAPGPDPAPPAQDLHHAATEADRALRDLQAESRAREEAAVERLRSQPLGDVVREHNAERESLRDAARRRRGQ